MAFFDELDGIDQRDPRDIHLVVNALYAVNDENVAQRSFLSTHLTRSDSAPSILISLWVTDPADDDEEPQSPPMVQDFSLSYAIPVIPDQARALAYGLLRLADGLELEVDRGVYGDQEMPEMETYFAEPRL